MRAGGSAQRRAPREAADPRCRRHVPAGGTQREGNSTSHHQLPTPRLLCIGAHPDDCEIRPPAGPPSGPPAVEPPGSSRWRLQRRSSGAGWADWPALGGRKLVRRGRGGLTRSSSTTSTVHFCRRWRTGFGSFGRCGCNSRVIATRRTNDYHPDHRYTGVTVQDACYMVMVPKRARPVPDGEPVVMFMSDNFTKPPPIDPDLVFNRLGDRKKGQCDHQPQSQIFEWLPSMRGRPTRSRRTRPSVKPTSETGPHKSPPPPRQTVSTMRWSPNNGEPRGREVRLRRGLRGVQSTVPH